MNKLFSPVQLGPITLNNRMVMAPMTRNRAPENIPTALMVEYYSQRAGAGLIITEGAQVSEQGVGYPATPGIYNEPQTEGWKQVVDAVHGKGGKIFAQLWHCGRVSHPDYHGGDLPVGPSAIKPAGQAFTWEGLKDFVAPRALESDEIAAIVEQFRNAAACAKTAGFDGVEIHAANGYLIDQFIRDGSNQRNDQYGGSLENRTRLLLEIIAAVSGEIGSQRVGVRLSPVNGFNDMSDSNPQATFNHVADSLTDLDLAYLHVVEVNMAGEVEAGFDPVELRSHFDGTYIANGGYDRERAQTALADGNADLIAFGVPFLANPDLPDRFKLAAELNPPDQNTFYGGDKHGYTDYPALELA